MPVTARRPSSAPPRRARGFTLLEVLVVMLIIGVLISFAVLSISRGDTSLRDESQRLAALIRLAGQEAISQGQEFAVEFDQGGYAFVTFDGEAWQPVADDELLRRRELPQHLVIDVELEGERLVLAGQAQGEEKETPPRIFLLSSGEMSPFDLTLRKSGAGGGYHITGTARGDVQVNAPADE